MFYMIKNFCVDLLKNGALLIIDNSYWIFLTICLISIILYVAGLRKAGKYCSVSFVLYVLFQALKGVLL